MRLLALDIGMRRTGIAFVDSANGITLPLDTIITKHADEMIQKVIDIAKARNVQQVIVGLPLLPSGVEGSQTEYVRSCADQLTEHGVIVSFLDERYTTSKSQEFDGDARAACQLLDLFVQRL